ncbi:MAG: protein kinase domain-containing protein [Pyrinomonadaceae bacterium]
MSPERWQQVEQLYLLASEREPSERTALLDEACAGDEVLRREVESLLVYEQQAESFIEAPALEVAAKSLADEQARSIVGRLIGHYQVLSLLGAGGMGEVYLAEDTALGRRVALKLLPPAFTREADRARRFEREARAASALNHPNILTIYEIGRVDGAHFIATEFIEGQTLRQRMSGSGMELDEALDISIQVAGALAAAHEAGIVHRDIKPENIMLRRDRIIKVLDFGLAKLTTKLPAGTASGGRAPAQVSVKTEPGVVMGTAHYMSPEQLRGQEVDARTDIFSLGVLIYEMIACRQPFAGDTPSDCIASILKTEPSPLAEFAPEVPAELERIVFKALEKDREERYQVVQDLLLDLKKLKHHMEFEAERGRSIPPATAALTGKIVVTPTQSSAEYVIGEVKLHRRAASIFLATLVSALVGVAYFYSGGRDGQAINSVAVLPFINVNADPNTEYLSDGIADSLINSLSQLSDLKVMSFNSVSRYKGGPFNAQTVGRELKVQAVVIGRLTQQGDELAINVELVDARDLSRIWGAQYNRRSAGVLALQQEIAEELSENLHLKLNSQEQGRLAKSYTENPEAYQLYLKGRFFWNKRSGEGLQRGIEHFDQAIALDPGYALAYAGLADCYGLLPNYSSTSPTDALPRAKAAALKALELDDQLAEAHTSLGLVKKDYDWDFASADREFRRAIELNPNYATAYHWQAENLVTLRRLDEAIAAMKRAQELDPFSLIINGEVGWVYYHARQYDEAIEQLQKTVEMDPHFPRNFFFLGRAYEQERMYEEAISATQQAVALSSGYTLFKASLGHIYGMAGQRGEAQRLLNELRERSNREYVSPVAVALIHTGLGDRDQAFAWLEKAYQEHDTILVYYLRDPQLEGLQSDPRFADLLRRVGLTL